ncbi:hypothetical protein HID58_041758 [Brassica napus]|uniref:DUF3741 domain-containing protein n=1 Tax=Brassica napus TaxID=3708 RepID=A0ABQ8BBQ9_BRANA|nr:hypothetical protein HID58_041758 [Brassica napus]
MNKSNEANGYITALYQHFHHHYQPTLGCTKKQLGVNRVYSIKRKKIASTLMQLMETTGKKIKSQSYSFPHISSYYCNSPSAKKPNVVSRLMALDLLPDDLGLSRSSRNRVRGHGLFEKG